MAWWAWWSCCKCLVFSEGYKRNTTGGNDARTSGAIAMYTVQRDLRQAGYNVTLESVLGCSLTLRSGVSLNALAPIIINPPTTTIPAGDSNTDTLLIVTGNGKGPPEGDQITLRPSTPVYQVAAASLYRINDYVIAVKPPENVTRPCALSMERVTSVTSPTVTVPIGDATKIATDWLLNLGDSPKVQAYAVRNGALTVCDYMVNNCATASTSNQDVWVPIADNIVSMRADYAKDTDADTIVDSYDQATPADAASPTLWKQIIAVRMVLVARSGQYDKAELTTAAPTWAGSTSATPIPITLSSNTDWKHYRYKEYETIVPLRNMAN